MDLPYSTVAAWPVPNYTNPVVRGPALWITISLFFSASTLAVGTRLYTRVFIRRWVGMDDGLILIAYISTIGVTICTCIGNRYYDWNKHVWDVPINHISGSLKVLYLSRIFWGVATSSVRLSILCLYYRLLNRCDGSTFMRWVLNATTCWTIGLLLYYLIIGIFPCTPIRAYWSWPFLSDRHCSNDGLSLEVSAVLNTLSELFIATLPVIAVFRLRVEPRQRLGITGLLSLNFLVAIVGIFRTFFIFRLVESYDFTWWSSPQWITSEVEIDLGLISACAAPLRPVIGRLICRLRGSPEILQTRGQNDRQTTLSEQPKNVTQSSSEVGPEGLTDWERFQSRVIDLEGIGEDGSGYTVTISGPPKRGKRLFDSLRKTRTRSMEEGLRTEHAMDRISSNAIALGVIAEKSFQITETFQDKAHLSGDFSGWGSLEQSRVVKAEEKIEQAATGVGLRQSELKGAYGEFGDLRGPGTEE